MKAESSTMVAKQVSFRQLVLGDALRLAPGILTELLGGFGISLILGRYLPATAMGLFTLFWLAQTYAGALLTNWLRIAVIRFLPEDSSRLSAYLRFAFLTIAVTGLLGIVTVALLESIWSERFNGTYLTWTVVILCLVSAYTIFQSMLRGVFDQWRYSTSAVLLVGLKVLLLLAFLPNASDPTAAVLIVMAVSYLPVLGWQAHRLWRLALVSGKGRQPLAEPSLSLLQQSWTYGVPLALSVLILTVLQSGDRYILANLIDLQDVGVYAFWTSIGLQFGRGMYNLILAVLNPRLFQLHSVDPVRARARVPVLAGLYVVIFAPLFTTLGCVTPLVLRVLGVRSEYVGSSYLIFFGLGTAFLLGLTQLCGKLREFDAKTSAFVWAALLGTLAMGTVSFALIPIAGLTGAASATLVGVGVYFAFVALRSHSLPPLRDVLLGMIGSMALFLVYQGVSGQQSESVGLLSMTGVAVFYAAVISSRFRLERTFSDA